MQSTVLHLRNLSMNQEYAKTIPSNNSREAIEIPKGFVLVKAWRMGVYNYMMQMDANLF